MNIAVFASHGGSDLQAIIDGCKSKKINAEVKLVISNNLDSMSLQRAKNDSKLERSNRGYYDTKIIFIM